MDQKNLSLKIYLALTLSLIIVLLFLYILKPFFMVLFWAAILAFYLHPFFQKINVFLKNHRSISALITLFVFILFILIPLSLFFVLFYTQVQNLISNFNLSILDKAFFIFSKLKEKILFSYIYPYIEPTLENIKNQLPQYVTNLMQYLVQSLGNIFVATLGSVLKIVFTLFTLYYFLSDGDKIINAIKELIPAEASSKENFIKKISEILKAILYGSILTSIAQGLIALVIYLILAVPQPFLFAFLTMLASYMPFLGTALIWIPLSLYLLITGSYIKALLLFIFCALTVAQIDNILKPFLISGKTKIHNLLMFFSVLGGMYRFGITGLFLGPIILGLFLSVIEIYKARENSQNFTKESL